MESLLNSFPLPSAPSHQCRDEFLKELLEPYHIQVDEKDSASDADKDIDKVRFYSNLYNTEERLMDHFLRHQYLVRHSVIEKITGESKITVVDVNQMLKNRYDDLATSISFMAVVFELTEVANWMNISRQMWRMKSNVDRSLRMFSWSIQDYFTRFGLRNQVYLDQIELELKGQMDCFKFCKDMKEINRLVGAICNDFKLRRDLCTNSMLLIRDAEIDINELLTNMEIEAKLQQHQLAKAIQMTPRSADPDRRRQKALQKKVNYIDFIAPIEARYRINWAQAALDQAAMYEHLQYEQMSAELKYWNTRVMEVRYLWEISCMAYDMEIENYKNRITQVEVTYEIDMEKCENDIQITQNKLHKVKEDLIFYKDQVPKFHARIEEVLQFFSEQDEKNRASNKSKERKSSRHSKKKSVLAQKKK